MLLELGVVCTTSDLSTISMKHCQIKVVSFQAAFKWFVRRQKKVFWADAHICQGRTGLNYICRSQVKQPNVGQTEPRSEKE